MMAHGLSVAALGLRVDTSRGSDSGSRPTSSRVSAPQTASPLIRLRQPHTVPMAPPMLGPPSSISGRIVVKYAWTCIRSCGSSIVSRMMADVMIETDSPTPCTQRATIIHSMVGANALPKAPAM